jgi:hypothetical protein
MVYGNAITFLCTTSLASIIGPNYIGNWSGKYKITQIKKLERVGTKEGVTGL